MAQAVSPGFKENRFVSAICLKNPCGAKRRRGGSKCRPLPVMRPGADPQYKVAPVVTAYDEEQVQRVVMVTRGDREVTGRLLRRLAAAITLKATESIANICGAPWVRNRLEYHHIVDEINSDYYHLKDHAQKARREMFGDIVNLAALEASHFWEKYWETPAKNAV